MNLPICRARKIDSDEYIIGHYFNRKNMLGKIIYHKIDFSTTCDKFAEIDPTTLKISFDNGKTWKTFEEVRIALGDK